MSVKHYIDELSVTGLTANPTILDHAIKNSASYDATIREKLKEDSCRTSGILASSPTA